VTLVPFRDRVKTLCPAWLQDGVGERIMYDLGLSADANLEKLVQGVRARLPTRAAPSALPVLGADRVIGRGLTESDDSYRMRLQRAFEAWQLAGSARADLSQLLGFLLAVTPPVREVASRYAADPARIAWLLARGIILSDPGSSYPNARLSSKWDTYPAGRDPTSEPVHQFVDTAGGNWDWDSLSPKSGSWGWWSTYIVLYSTAPNAWIGKSGKWGTGGKWGSSGNAWGVDKPAAVGRSIQIIVGQWKAAQAWCRSVIVCFDDTPFDPDQPVAGGVNPDGHFGRWSKIVGGVRMRARFTEARYGGEVI